MSRLIEAMAQYPLIDSALNRNPWALPLLEDLGDHDEETLYHSGRVAVINNALVPGDRSILGGLLHDRGKKIIPREVINASRTLTDTEWVLVRQHPELSYRDIFPHAPGVADIVLGHHKFQQNPYPQEDMHESEAVKYMQRMLALSDQTDAYLSDRPEQPALPPSVVRHRLMKSGFPPSLIDIAINTRLNITS